MLTKPENVVDFMVSMTRVTVNMLSRSLFIGLLWKHEPETCHFIDSVVFSSDFGILERKCCEHLNHALQYITVHPEHGGE